MFHTARGAPCEERPCSGSALVGWSWIRLGVAGGEPFRAVAWARAGLRPMSLGFLERCPYSDRDSGTAVSSVQSILIRRGCYVP